MEIISKIFRTREIQIRGIGYLKEISADGNLHTSECKSTKYDFFLIHVIDKAKSIMSKNI